MVLSVNIVKGGFVKMTFFPQIDRDDLVVNLTLSPGSDPAETKAILQKIEKAAWTVNKILNKDRTDSNSTIQCIASSIAASGHQGSLTIKLLDGETRNMESGLISNQIRDEAGKFYEAEELTYGVASIFGAAVQVGFVGDNTIELRAAKNELKQILLENPQLKNVADSELKSGDEFNLSLLPKAKSLGLTLGDIMRQVRQGYFGYQVQSLQRGDDEVKVWLRYENKSRQSFEALQNSKIRLGGKRYTVRELVAFDTKPGVLQINHVNGRTKFQLSASLNDPNASATEIFNEVKNELVPTILAKYPSVDVVYEGQSERAAEATGSIQTFLPLILLLVFFTVVLTFRSFKQAVLVIVLIPFAFIGVVAGHWLHGVPISILSMFGILAVAGVVINDSLVLVSTMNRYLKDGMPFRKALYEASLSRFRPIVLTSVTTVAGLMPLVLEKSMQAQFLIPMAISLSYGLMISTFVMLLLLPTWLVLNNHLTRITHWVWTGEKMAAEAAEPSIREDEQH
jgi:multidrug efflux pump subunit AcrB